MFDGFPPPEDLITLEPEEVAYFILDILRPSSANPSILHLGNFLQNLQSMGYGSSLSDDVNIAISEAWHWLYCQGMVADKVQRGQGFVFVTRRGKSITTREDFESYKKSYLLQKEMLDPILAKKVYHLFISGEYDTAIFNAFKEVEIRVRKACGFPSSDIGIKLIRKAFDLQSGLLTDQEDTEKDALGHLFAGAIGWFKNPSSHREVNYEDAGEVAKLIYFADTLLKIVEKRSEGTVPKEI